MASPSSPSSHMMGYLCGVAMATSMLWYMFWMVLSPVREDISPLINWYFFTKLSLRSELDFYGALRCVHNWLPLLVITALVLSKASIIYRSFLVNFSQLLYVAVICYNVFLVVFMVYAGWKVVQLFLVALPLYLLLHCGPLLSMWFSPHTLWLPTSLCLLLYFVFCRHIPTADKRSHKAYGVWDLTALGALKRTLAMFSLPVLLAGLTFCVMERGCLPCSSTVDLAGTTPSKPSLVGHRGCAFDFPENSVAAFENAVLLPAVSGLETDVFVSMDGVLFLHHDLHLLRTTDVLAKCPAHDPYANATLLRYHNGSCPLSQLNVGRSFLGTSKAQLSAEEATLFQSQLVPTFGQFLDVAVKNGKSVIFDVTEPPVGHPHHHDYLNRTLEALVAAGVPQNKVWWSPVEKRQWVHEHYPHFTLTTKTEQTPFQELQPEHILKINDDWSTPLASFREYQQINLSINMFFVESAFMFRYAWCIGIPTVTTSNCKLLSKVNSNPFLQICRSWWHNGVAVSWPVWISGLVIFTLQLAMFVGCEVFRLYGGGLTNKR